MPAQTASVLAKFAADPSLALAVTFVVDGVEESRLPEAETPEAGVRWHDLPDIPPVMIVRMILLPPGPLTVARSALTPRG